MMIRFLFISLLFLSVSLQSHAWNAMGHKLVAQIAYDNLTPAAKDMCDKYTKAYSKVSPGRNFVTAATWLDSIRRKDVHWFDSMHFIDIPFSKDETVLPPVQEVNALWGIKQAISVLASDKATAIDKGLSLRILTHLVGDIHQPLHTVTYVSQRLPKGDLGGNLFKLGKNPIGNNLHKYWDNGAGVLIGQSKSFQVRNKALQLESKWSCTQPNQMINPEKWVAATNKIALSEVYNIHPYATPSKKYQLNAQNISQKQIHSAGCRLAYMLNTLAKNNLQSVS